jgi:hypothetical protein
MKRGTYLQTFSIGSHAITSFSIRFLVRISSPECPKSRQSLVCTALPFNKLHHLSTTADCSVSYITLKRRLTLWLHSHMNTSSSARLIFKWLSLSEGSRAQRMTTVSTRPPLWSSGQSFWLQIQRYRVRFPELPDFLRSNGSGTGSTQPREYNWGATWMEK